MEKEDILELPIFPKYLVETFGNVVRYSSAVYVHYDKEKCVEVLLQPVVNQHVVCRGVTKQMFVEHHLKSCLMVSKYALITPEYKRELPCIDTIFKSNSDFLNILHYTYP